MKKMLILGMVFAGVSLVAMENDPDRVNGNGNYYPCTLEIECTFDNYSNDCPVSPIPSPVPGQGNN